MGKVASTAALVTVGTGTSLSGAYFLGAFDSPTVLFKDKADFVASNGGECVQSLFPGISKMEGGTATDSSTNKVDSTYFSKVSDSKSGCLVVNGNKETYDENNNEKKGKGHFEFVGTHLVGEDKGFIVFTQLSSPSSGSDLAVSGIAYTVTKNGGNGKLDKKHDITDTNKKLSNSDFESKFPKVGTSLKKDPITGDYWNFLSKKDDLNNICSTGNCTGKPKKVEYLQGKGTWKKETNGDSQQSKVTEGTANLDDGWNDFYTNTNWNMKTIFDSVQGVGNLDGIVHPR